MGKSVGTSSACPRCRTRLLALPDKGRTACPKCGCLIIVVSADESSTAETSLITPEDIERGSAEKTQPDSLSSPPLVLKPEQTPSPPRPPAPAPAPKRFRRHDSSDTVEAAPKRQSSSFKQMVSLVRGIRQAGNSDWQTASQTTRTGPAGSSSRPAPPLEETGYQPKAGEVIGQIRLVMPVGRGSFGAVWKGTHLKTGEDVAIKFLSQARENEHPQYRVRFLREARAARRVRHPNLVAVLDAGTHEERLYMVQEYVSGESLGEIVRREGALPEAMVLNIAQAVGEALQAAHHEHIIHRDVKPDNILVSADGPIKLIDLGLAKDRASAGESSLTAPETALGTPRYMAPEQARDARSADERSDLYSLGATLFHLATGRLPFQGGMLETIVCHATEPITPPRAIRPEISEALSRLIIHLMAKRPENRVQHTDQLLDLVRRVRWGLSIPECPHANDPFMVEGSTSARVEPLPLDAWTLRPIFKLAALAAAGVLLAAIVLRALGKL